ncbi:MAG: hypothetical protein U5L98_08545 [Halomonas sp.]|uniref:hypothetical protein n=1 Tax=Halomonas sp. TaxID=1486246 RepID=UPI002ACD6A98|nr:hypothetical protein [Halomonas sp.]MDZ7852674.1 hypothetical protein [Halomonas sp.]
MKQSFILLHIGEAHLVAVVGQLDDVHISSRKKAHDRAQHSPQDNGGNKQLPGGEHGRSAAAKHAALKKTRSAARMSHDEHRFLDREGFQLRVE